LEVERFKYPGQGGKNAEIILFHNYTAVGPIYFKRYRYEVQIWHASSSCRFLGQHITVLAL